MKKLPDFTEHKYEVLRELGRNREGGRATFLAKMLDNDQLIVIKQFCFVQTDASWQGFKAYEREIQILQELSHPRIPRYIDSFETSDGFCMVQEYLDAPSLASKHSLEAEDIKVIAVSVLEILVYLQRRIPPVIHRDIKPENILVDQERNAYLVDFGLARIRSEAIAFSSVVAGTPGFMPPESLFNLSLTKASDLYSLGVTIISLITETRSVDISSLIDEDYRFEFKSLIAELNLSPKFINWLQKMVEPKLKKRYANAAIALRDLEDRKIVHSLNSRLAHVGSSKYSRSLGVAGMTLTVLGLSSGILYLQSTETSEAPTKTVNKTSVNKTSTVQISPTSQYEPVDSNSTELHVIGIYESYPDNRDREVGGEAVVNVSIKDRPIILALSAYEKTNWVVRAEDSVEIVKVILSGYHSQAVTGISAEVPIEVYTYDPSPCQRCYQSSDYFYSYELPPSSRLKEITGLEVTSWQGRYGGTHRETFSIFPNMRLHQ